jgi:hypothetical protein
LEPGVRPVTPDVGEDGVVIIPVPLSNVHVPAPVVGAFPASVAVVPQMVWFGPALEVVGEGVTVIVTLEEEEEQGALEIVHWKTLAPTLNPVTPEFGDEGVVIVPVPETKVHKPVPVVGVLPASVAVVPQMVWFRPALETVGAPTPVMVTVDEEDVQGELLMVHWKTLAPIPNPVTPEVGEEGVVIVPVPETRVHKPVPVVGVFPASVAVVPQTVWLEPALEAVGAATPVIVTVEEEAVQGELLMVHWKTLAPTPNPVTPDVAEEGVVIVPVPETSVHKPVPVVGVFPASVAVVPQTVWLGPAFAVVGAATPVIVTVDEEAVQGELLMVHWKTLAPTPNPVTPEFGDEGVVIVPVPETKVHKPVPVVGVFPASVAVVPQTV